MNASEPVPVCWTALIQDTNLMISVLDENGVFLYANDVVDREFGRSNAEIVGKTMHDFVAHPIADERLEAVRRVIQTGQAMAVEGMVSGQLRRSIFRPMPPDDHGRRRVLAVCRQILEDVKSETPDGVPVVRAKHDDLGVLGALTAREMDILRLIGQGLSTAEIAKRLHRSVKTIEWHRVSLGTKLGVTNRVELARIAIRAGVVGLAEGAESADEAENSVAG